MNALKARRGQGGSASRRRESTERHRSAQKAGRQARTLGEGMRHRPTGTDTRPVRQETTPSAGRASSHPRTLATPCQAASRCTFESAEVGGCDGERAVIEELAYGLHRLADVAAELGGGVSEDVHARGREAGLREIAPEAVVEGGAGDAVGDQRRPARGTRRAAWRLGPCRHH